VQIFSVETERLRMRRLEPRDRDLYCHLFTDQETMHFIGAPLTPERAARSFDSALAGMDREPMAGLFLTVVEKSSRQDVGICSLQNLDAQRRSVQGGLMFVAGVRAQGYAKEAFTGLIQQVFKTLPVDELWVQFAADHVAVTRTVIGLGFERRPEASENGPRRQATWSVHRDSWSPRAPLET
jgi:RimJ/RimL family protein N-acetyltransferase